MVGCGCIVATVGVGAPPTLLSQFMPPRGSTSGYQQLLERKQKTTRRALAARYGGRFPRVRTLQLDTSGLHDASLGSTIYDGEIRGRTHKGGGKEVKSGSAAPGSVGQGVANRRCFDPQDRTWPSSGRAV